MPVWAQDRHKRRASKAQVELAHQTNNMFNLNRRGYLFATADPARIEIFQQAAEEAATLGAGPVRYHTGQPGDTPYRPAAARGFADSLTGADIILDRDLIRQHFPYLSERTVAVLHARRCGWFSAQQFGMYLLEQARARGVELLTGRVESVDLAGNRIQAVGVETEAGRRTIYTDNFVNAAGPFQKKVARMIGVELPVFSELHVKVAFNDHLGLVPRHAPLVIWTDPVRLAWSAAEQAMLAESEETSWMLAEFPPGVHARPDGDGGSTILLILWTCDTNPVEPTFPISSDFE